MGAETARAVVASQTSVLVKVVVVMVALLTVSAWVKISETVAFGGSMSKMTSSSDLTADEIAKKTVIENWVGKRPADP